MGLAFTVEHSAQAANSPAKALIYEGVNELVQENLTPDDIFGLTVSPTDAVVFAVTKDEKDIVGAVCYRVSQELRIAVVSLAYVEPSSRMEGVFKALWQAMLERVGVHADQIMVRMHAANEGGAAVAAKCGGRKRAVVYEFFPNQ